jgi:ankyrin repeat protein
VDVNRKIDGLTPIYLACKASSAATVEILLEAGANPSVKCEDGGLNCLHQLCHVGASCIPNYADAKVLREIFMLLIRHGVDVNERTALGATALHGAVMGSAVLTRLLVDSGADGNAEDYEGLTPLYKVRGYNYGFGAPACRIPVDPIEILIEQGQADVNHVRPSGDTLLHWMLRELPSERTLTFLKYAPICNVLDQYGNSPLHNALRSGNLPVVEGLLKAGADPNMLSRDGLAPMFCLRDDYFSPELVDIFLGAGADLNTVDQNGKSILFHMLPTYTLLWDHKRALERFTALVNRGASTSIRDFEGRTVLHEIVQTLDARAAQRLHGRLPSKPVFDILADLGLDVKAVDYAGNSLLHEIAGRTDNHYKSSLLPPLWEYLLAMGLDLAERNNAGRTPLHILCGSAIDMRPPGFDRERLSPMDMLISRKVSVSATDHNGITPLHIAATRGEQCTKKLLDAGADATACTREGLTALHLASRCGRSNVVGMLLAALGRETSFPAGTQSQPGAAGSGLMKNPVKGVNASAYGRDEITPLFYACQSGRPETVALLIEAGADVELGSILQACAGFEGGDHLSQLSQWPKRRGDKLLLLDNICHASPAERRHYESGSADFDVCTNETSRLQEILHMLIPLGTELSNPHHREKINASIDEAVSSGRDYTARCLREARDKYLSGLANVNQEKVVSVLSGFMHHSLHEASVQSLNVSGLVRQGAANPELFRYFLRRREYHLVEELCLLGADFLRTPSDKQPCNLAILVRAGLCDLVQRTGHITAESELNKGHWHAFGDDTRPGLWFARRYTSNSGDFPVPFLLEAVQRELPNLDMMRLLVETFRVGVNEVRIGLGKVRIPNGMLRNSPVPTDSALHYAARGYSWWHAHEALPYLLKVGADANLRSYNEDTPLHVALWRLNYKGPFAKDAARILVENGADVNAIGNDGRSCLACAADDVDMIRLLVRHGATLNSEALFAAIDANNVEGVRELLTLRLDPSLRRGKLAEEAFDATGMCIRPHSYVATRLTGVPLYHEVFPLYHAGMAQSLRQWRGPDESVANLECAIKIIQLLLEHGADPFARFLSRINKPWETTALSDAVKDTPSIEVPENHRECTILHELLIVGSVVDPFLNFPGLDVNCRDAKGRTLLNAACQSSAGPDVVHGSHEEQANRDDHVTMFHRLTSLGAEIRARDNSGRNVLHHMIAGNTFETTFDQFKRSLASVLREAPDLIHETDDDKQTPLHYAVSRADMSRDTRAAQALLQAGSDPLVVDKNANSLLHVLAKCLDAPAQVSLFQYLARRGVDMNGRNEGGETPLFIFCKNDKSERRGHGDDTWQEVSGTQILLMLREMGANLYIRDAKDRGLLHVAARNDASLFTELMDAGLDPMLEDKAQQTAIDVAAVSENQDVLELFERRRDR